MASRPVFVAMDKVPFFRPSDCEFTWNGGFAKSQKQKNIQALHAAFCRKEPDKKVLEISSKSLQESGEKLSAFFLPKYVPSLGKSVPVECAYHAGKIFANGGPYLDLLGVSPKEAKRDERLQTSGPLIGFQFEGQRFPTMPKTLFYDYLYMNALLENEELAKTVLSYDAFTDIEYNPQKSLACQAKAAAAFVGLNRLGLLDQVKDLKSFLALYRSSISSCIFTKPNFS